MYRCLVHFFVVGITLLCQMKRMQVGHKENIGNAESWYKKSIIARQLLKSCFLIKRFGHGIGLFDNIKASCKTTLARQRMKGLVLCTYNTLLALLWLWKMTTRKANACIYEEMPNNMWYRDWCFNSLLDSFTDCFVRVPFWRCTTLSSSIIRIRIRSQSHTYTLSILYSSSHISLDGCDGIFDLITQFTTRIFHNRPNYHSTTSQFFETPF